LLRAARRARRNPDRAPDEINAEIDLAVNALYGVLPAEHARLASFLRTRLGFNGDA
jgi:hypothetical protein